MIYLVVFVNILLLAFVTYARSKNVIHTTHGDVTGGRVTVMGRVVDVYWGIPYAKTPPDRFRPPEPGQPWDGVLAATTPPPACPEVPYPPRLIPLEPKSSAAFHEDCLNLNLWVPRGCMKEDERGGSAYSRSSFRRKATRGRDAVEVEEDDSLAVMVWIHGGGLEWGTGSTTPTYNGQVLAATQCVIVASMNYRQGPLGFLALGLEEAPGNVGLLDQALALTWIRDNAHSFGGSQRRITLFGESAGSLSVAAHMASPVSRDLFARAILMSGTPFGSSLEKSMVQSISSARQLASLVGCTGDDRSLLSCLRKVDGVDLCLATQNLTRANRFGVVVDGFFLRQPLAASFRNPPKAIPLMVGATKDDGSFIYSFITIEDITTTAIPFTSAAEFRRNLSSFAIPFFAGRSFPEGRSEGLAAVLQVVEKMYLQNQPVRAADPELRSVLNRVLTDLAFVCPMHPTAEAFLGRSEVFMYSFNHRSSASPFPAWMGVVHASELDFVFGRPFDQRQQFTERERQLSLTMMKAWAIFAKTGNPNTEWTTPGLPTYWPSVNREQSPYAVFGRSSAEDIGIHWDRLRGCPYCAFWNDLYPALASAFDV